MREAWLFLKGVERFWLDPKEETADFELLEGNRLRRVPVRTARLVRLAKAQGFRGGTPFMSQGYYWRAPSIEG